MGKQSRKSSSGSGLHPYVKKGFVFDCRQPQKPGIGPIMSDEELRAHIEHNRQQRIFHLNKTQIAMLFKDMSVKETFEIQQFIAGKDWLLKQHDFFYFWSSEMLKRFSRMFMDDQEILFTKIGDSYNWELRRNTEGL